MEKPRTAHTKRQEHVTIVLYIVLQENMASSMGQDDEVSAPKMIYKNVFFGSDHYFNSVPLWPTATAESFDLACLVTVIL